MGHQLKLKATAVKDWVGDVSHNGGGPDLGFLSIGQQRFTVGYRKRILAGNDGGGDGSQGWGLIGDRGGNLDPKPFKWVNLG
ncbi:hypothetical protein HanRHA438_Chr13g0608801 [Helianthus annuus]|uniref:Uncharacterized protein n=1 Tax=Helianthus annuus TaxID=4232 RepID=A0A251STX1_HELAN|nr:hypothetical protein HanXRQr2_Chr13g0598171 [Helianthus annuus]KAJ0477632.1 hypothetical protein HanHA300_Chr13g0490761 [Helianthus annuus]KAJ0482156.1 hypothetical protein HanIR_Chr13g0650721 [Helianthus annuus]KAJ0498463.1 hypothetical protein HanHA89_Chr13g0522891 [Helianthus annuus]KAJ0664479.1 hypothetical protein HanLR1_Chr13g0492891 [Helianthus annuus]